MLDLNAHLYWSVTADCLKKSHFREEIDTYQRYNVLCLYESHITFRGSNQLLLRHYIRI